MSSEKKRRNRQPKAENPHEMRMGAFRAKSPNQKQLFNHLVNPETQLVISTGCAGTGKSYTGAYAALSLYFENEIDRIVITRNPIPTGQSLGFFKGDVREKMEAWMAPVLGTFRKILYDHTGNPGLFEYMVNKEKIFFQPIETVKGSSFDRTFILVEEAQEMSMEQLKTLTTRVGQESTIFLNGDIHQANTRMAGCDMKTFVDMIIKDNQRVAGLANPKAWEKIDIPIIDFGECDIVRSDITRRMVNIFSRNNI